MSISVRSNFINSNGIQSQQGTRKSVVETSTGKKSVTPNSITAGTGVDKAENDGLLRKMQFTKTKAEALQEYLGAMQKAVEDSSNGMTMLRRVDHMSGTAKIFRQLDEYKNKKEQETFVTDQLDAIKRGQEKAQRVQEQLNMNRQETAAPEKERQQKQDAEAAAAAESDSFMKTVVAHQRTAASTANTGNAELQKKAAEAYKSKDAPKRNPYVQEFFTGMM